MLLSQKEERDRRFKLALRAGLPVLLLIFLLFYTTLYKESNYSINIEDSILIASITFITIYFIYFLMNLSVEESILDQTTQGFNRKTFIKKLQRHKAKSIACLKVENLSSISANYSIDQVEHLLYTINHKLQVIFQQHALPNVLIGSYSDAEFLIALDENHQEIQDILEEMIENNTLINAIEVDYKCAIITNTNENFEKIILQLRDIIESQYIESPDKNSSYTQDAKALSLIEQEVISSIQKKKLHLSFRPLLDSHSGKIDIYEIAVKLKSDTGQDILPRVFLPIINRLGLGRNYDLTLVKHVIDLLPLVNDNIAFTFNLSPFSLRDSSFKERFFNYLKEKKVNPSRLIIQLYERRTHHDLSGYLKTLKDFRAHGMRICIDNFGSSNASMEYMKHFKFDMIQFDRDYVTNLEDPTNYAMLHSLIKMSKDLEIQSVAKWVDNEAQKKKLRVLGIQYMQGFGIGKVLSEDALIRQYN